MKVVGRPGKGARGTEKQGKASCAESKTGQRGEDGHRRREGR